MNIGTAYTPSNYNPRDLYDESTNPTDNTKHHRISEAALEMQNEALRRQNDRLTHDLQEFTSKLEVELSKRTIANDHSSFVRLENEYMNCQKLLSLYKREIVSLRRKVIAQPQSRIEELQAIVKERDREIEVLKSQVKGLKKLNQYQQKGLVQAAGDGVLQCFKDYEILSEEHKKLQRRCEDYEKQLRRKALSNKVIEVHSTQDIEKLEVYEKQLQMLKLLDIKNKKQLFSTGKELERMRAQRQKLAEQLKEKDKEVQRSHYRILEMRKFVQPKRVTEASLEESSYHKGRRHRTLPSDDSDHQSISPSSRFKAPSPQLRKPIRSYKPNYPKFETRGDSNPISRVWNDSKFSSKIVEMHIALDSNNKIEQVHCRYERGTPDHLLQDRTYNTFKCREGEFIHLISGGFYNKFLEFLVLITNEKRKIKFGVESTSAVKFDFNIQDGQHPCALFGEIATIDGEFRINKFGCLIQRD